MARRFRFRLETVRKIRERERDAQRRIVAEKVHAVEAIRDRVAVLTGGMDDNRSGARDARRPGWVSINLLRGHVLHQTWLARTIETTREELDERLGEFRVEQGKLAESSKRLKVIEKLRERKWEQYQVKLVREEIQAGDEASQQMFRRARQGATAS